MWQSVGKHNISWKKKKTNILWHFSPLQQGLWCLQFTYQGSPDYLTLCCYIIKANDHHEAENDTQTNNGTISKSDQGLMSNSDLCFSLGSRWLFLTFVMWDYRMLRMMTWPWKPSRCGWALFLGQLAFTLERSLRSLLYFKHPSLWPGCWFAIAVENFWQVTHPFSSNMLRLIIES